MSNLEDVLEEQWRSDGTDIYDGETPIFAAITSSGGPTKARTIVAVLGKRALAMVLRHEWHGLITVEGSDGGAASCVRCSGIAPDDESHEAAMLISSGEYSRGHKPDCEWGRIVAEAKSLGQLQGVASPHPPAIDAGTLRWGDDCEVIAIELANGSMLVLDPAKAPHWVVHKPFEMTHAHGDPVNGTRFSAKTYVEALRRHADEVEAAYKKLED